MSLGLLSRWAFFVALGVIIGGSLAQNPGLPSQVARYDMLLHMAGYFSLALLAGIGWPRRRGLALVGLPLFGLALEVAQSATPARSFSWMDALANAVGVGLAVALCAMLMHWLDRE